jgi:hypothetical protein
MGREGWYDLQIELNTYLPCSSHRKRFSSAFVAYFIRKHVKAFKFPSHASLLNVPPLSITRKEKSELTINFSEAFSKINYKLTWHVDTHYKPTFAVTPQRLPELRASTFSSSLFLPHYGLRYEIQLIYSAYLELPASLALPQLVSMHNKE